MRKSLTLLFTGIMAVLLFAQPGLTVNAAEVTTNDDCACHDVTFIQGAEKNKMVSDLLKSDVFKQTKSKLMQEGYAYRGVSSIEVVKIKAFNITMIGVPFINSNGIVEMAAFSDGVFLGITPPDEQ